MKNIFNKLKNILKLLNNMISRKKIPHTNTYTTLINILIEYRPSLSA